MKFTGILRAVLFTGIVAWAGAAFAQEEKKDAAIAPVAALGDLSDREISFLYNGLQSTLSDNYRLVSAEDYQQAEEHAFATLDAEKCTEEQCIRVIQELLQVDRLFVLQVLREGNATQLTLTLTRAQDKIVKSTTCEDCSVIDLDKKIAALTKTVVASDLGQVSGALALFGEERTSRDNRQDALFFADISPFGSRVIQESTVNAHIGVFIGDSWTAALEYGAGTTSPSNYYNFSRDVFFIRGTTASQTTAGVHVRWFAGWNSFNVSAGLQQTTWAGQLNEIGCNVGNCLGFLSSTGSAQANSTTTMLRLGLGNSWLFDSGLTIGADWITYPIVLSSSTSATKVEGCSYTQSFLECIDFASLPPEQENLIRGFANTVAKRLAKLASTPEVLVFRIGWAF